MEGRTDARPPLLFPKERYYNGVVILLRVRPSLFTWRWVCLLLTHSHTVVDEGGGSSGIMEEPA